MSDIGAETTSLLAQRDAAANPDPSQDEGTIVDASKLEVPQDERSLAKEILKNIAAWKKHHEKAFERMKRDVRFATNKNGAQWDGTEAAPMLDSYVANITFNHIQRRTGLLYAKNPRVKAGRRRRIDYKLWDGTPEMLQQAQQALQAAANAGRPRVVPGPNGQPMPAPPVPPPPLIDVQGAQAVMAEAQQIKQRRQMLDRIGKTAEVLYEHFMNEGNPAFKARAKAWVRRTLTCGVGWLKLDFERQLGYTAQVAGQIDDLKVQLDHLQSELEKVADGETDEGSARVAEIQGQLELLTTSEKVVTHEGVLFGFPKSWRVIPDQTCSQLTGLVDCWEMAEEMPMTPDEIREAYKVDVKNKFTQYQGKGKDGKQRTEAMVYEHYNRRTGLMSVVCEGYDGFLVKPGPPRVAVKRFFPFYPLSVNEMECEDGEIYPPSDVELLHHQQREYNRSREALRQHRNANQPGYLANKADFSNEADVLKMKDRQPHDVVMLDGIGSKKAEELLRPIPLNPIDPNIYEVNQVFQDVQRTVGDQAANLGGTTDATATEVSTAENSRLSSVSSNADDLDGVLTEVARDGCHVMLTQVSQAQALEIAGQGAMWPGATGDDYSAELYLDIVAGSSGLPNRDRDAAIIERLFPLALQTGNINPKWLATKVVQLMDETVDIEEAVLDGLPSILALNALAKGAAPMGGAPGGGDTPTGDPATDPTQQGAAPAGPAMGGGGPGTSFPAPNAAPVGATSP